MSEFEYSRFGDYLDGKDDDIPEHINKEWIEVEDETISDLLLYLEIADVDLEENDIARLLKSKGANSTITKQLKHGNEEFLRIMRGSDQMGRDISGYRAIKSLESEWLKNADQQGVTKQIWFGEEGAGKTNGGLFEAVEVAPTVLKRYLGKKVAFVGNVEIGNVDELPLDRAHFINSTSELDEILEQYGDDPSWEIIVFIDEGDQILGGFGNSNVTGKAISDRVKLFRKKSAHIILTSQTLVTKDLRRNFGDIRYKPDKHNPDKLVVADQLTTEGVADDDKQWEATGLPETNAQYDTTAEGTWKHDTGDEDKEVEEARKRADEKQRELDEVLYNLHSSGMSYREIADQVDIPKSTVSDRVVRHRKRLEAEDSDD